MEATWTQWPCYWPALFWKDHFYSLQCTVAVFLRTVLGVQFWVLALFLTLTCIVSNDYLNYYYFIRRSWYLMVVYILQCCLGSFRLHTVFRINKTCFYFKWNLEFVDEFMENCLLHNFNISPLECGVFLHISYNSLVNFLVLV